MGSPLPDPEEPAPPGWLLLLAHHHPADGDRCTWVGPFAVCRRCLATWPLAMTVIGLGLAGRLSPASDLELVGWLGPPLGEYLATHAAGLPYRPARTWIAGALLGIAAGRMLHRYLLEPGDPVFWTLAIGAGLPCLWAAIRYQRRR